MMPFAEGRARDGLKIWKLRRIGGSRAIGPRARGGTSEPRGVDEMTVRFKNLTAAKPSRTPTSASPAPSRASEDRY
jgi:hypothetical protein